MIVSMMEKAGSGPQIEEEASHTHGKWQLMALLSCCFYYGATNKRTRRHTAKWIPDSEELLVRYCRGLLCICVVCPPFYLLN